MTIHKKDYEHWIKLGGKLPIAFGTKLNCGKSSIEVLNEIPKKIYPQRVS